MERKINMDTILMIIFVIICIGLFIIGLVWDHAGIKEARKEEKQKKDEKNAKERKDM